MAGQSHHILERPSFDGGLSVMIVVAPYYKDIADDLVANGSCGSSKIPPTVTNISR